MISDPGFIYQLPEGTILKDRYEINSVLGKGGFGITYKGTDRMLELTVAVKEFFPHGFAIRSIDSSASVTFSTGQEAFDKWRERFLEEARILAKCNNVPSIVQVRDFFEENNTAYIVMEYLSGISLQEYLMRNGVIPAQKVFSYMIPLAHDLDQVHRLGLIHRDISPDNIMLMPDDTLKLFDFGAARTYSDEAARTMSVMLKPGYAPEEQYRKKGVQGPWTDVYGICATMYKCLTGVTPPDSLERLNGEELIAPSELGCSISADMERVLLKGMNIHSEDRFVDMCSLADEMEAGIITSGNITSGIGITEFMDDQKDQDNSSDYPDSAGGKSFSDQQPDSRLNTQKEKTKPKFPWPVFAVIAAILLIGLIIIVIINNQQSQPQGTTENVKNLSSDGQIKTDLETTQYSQNTYSMFAGTYEPVSDNTLPDSFFWGLRSFSGDDFLSSYKGFTDIETDRGSLNVSEFPVAFLINPAWEEPLICLCFTDQFKYLYFVYGSYEIEDDILRISAPAYPDSVPMLQPSDILDNVPVIKYGSYICQEGMSYPEEGKAYILQDTISLSWDLESGKIGKIRFKNEKNSITYQSGYINEKDSSHQILHLQGSVSDPERLYENMESIDLLYDPDRKDTDAVIIYEDGGKSLDTIVTSYYDPFGKFNLETTKIERLYNGRSEVFDDKKTLQFDTVNTWPYGFIIYEKLKDEDNYYCYQQPVKKE